MHQPGDCCQSSNRSPERNRYFRGKLLTDRDFTAEQTYFRDKLRRHNRIVHGAGVVCGLEVRPTAEPQAPWRVEVGPGCALGPYGDEILVCEPVRIDLASCCPPSPRGSGRRGVVFVTIEYAETPCAPAPPAGGANEADDGEPTRIRESFVIRCGSDCPEAAGGADMLCELLRRDRVAECPPCPGDPRLVLARITLPTSRAATLRSRHVDNGVRRSLFSLTMIQEQLIRCCCAPAPRRRAGAAPRGRGPARRKRAGGRRAR